LSANGNGAAATEVVADASVADAVAEIVTPSAQPAPENLSPLELRVFVAYLMGWPHWRIAVNCGINEQTVGAIVARPRFKAAQAAATSQVIAQGAQIATRLAELAKPALERVAYLMANAKAEQVQMRSAFDILDRAGHKPTEHVEHSGSIASTSFNLHALSIEDRDALRALAEKAARANVLGVTHMDPAIDKEIEL